MASKKTLTEKDFLKLGLEIAKYERWESYKEHCNIERFVDAYGATPKTCAEMWDDLKIIEEIDKYSKAKYLLMALRYLHTNDSERDVASFFGYIDRSRIRKHVKEYVEKIQTLLQLKMLTFEEADDGFVYFMSVDGTHCRIQEPRPFSKVWSSHKFGKAAAVNYEIGLSISKSKLIWLYGPIPAGLKNDLDVAKEKLVPKLQEYNKKKTPKRRIIADDIYKDQSLSDLFSNKNELDSKDLSKFKERVMARHENFNCLLKKWKILDTVFRAHDLDEHQVCFEAVAAIVCYQLDNGSYSLLDPYP